MDVNERTFNNPSQIANKISGQIFKCYNCDFTAERKSYLNNHTGENHNWCCFCLSSYKSQEILKDHIKTKHNRLYCLTGLKEE